MSKPKERTRAQCMYTRAHTCTHRGTRVHTRTRVNTKCHFLFPEAHCHSKNVVELPVTRAGDPKGKHRKSSTPFCSETHASAVPTPAIEPEIPHDVLSSPKSPRLSQTHWLPALSTTAGLNDSAPLPNENKQKRVELKKKTDNKKPVFSICNYSSFLLKIITPGSF